MKLSEIKNYDGLIKYLKDNIEHVRKMKEDDEQYKNIMSGEDFYKNDVRQLEVLESTERQVKEYSEKDVDYETETETDKVILDILRGVKEHPSEYGKDWPQRVEEAKLKGADDLWCYIIPRNATVLIMKDINTGVLEIVTHREAEWCANLPYMKYVVVATA